MALPALLGVLGGIGATLVSQTLKGVGEQAAQTVQKEAMKRTDTLIQKGAEKIEEKGESFLGRAADKLASWDF